MNIKNKKGMYLLLLIVICLAGIGIRGTYAKFAGGGETSSDAFNLNLSFNLNINNIEEYEEIKVPANTYKVFNVSITNDSDTIAYYGLWYQLMTKNLQEKDFIIARNIENDVPTSGNINSSEKKIITIIVKNNTSDLIKLNIGLATSSKGVDSIEYLDGKKLISGTTYEADYYYDDATDKYISTTDSNVSFSTTPINYSYTGKIQNLKIDHNGAYKLEAWGAQGASYDKKYRGGYGAYVVGYTNLVKNTSLYMNVGGTSSIANNNTVNGGYNGGDKATSTSQNIFAGGGGGASQISLKDGMISSLVNDKKAILLVAGGGGGAYYSKNAAFSGNDAKGNDNYNYGGGAGTNNGSEGGASYILENTFINKKIYCYNCEESSLNNKIYPTTNASEEAIANYVKIGAGAIKITAITPTINTPSSIMLNYQLKKEDITCHDNGAGCEVVRITDTTNLSGGTQKIIIIVKDNYGYIYKYVKTITVGITPQDLSTIPSGSYVKYTGSNGCLGRKCEGENANFESNTNMGYCHDSESKFTASGWRIAYSENNIAYLISAGSLGCLATNNNGEISNNNIPSSDLQNEEIQAKHLENLQTESLKYCNSIYAYNHKCDENSTWTLKEDDFKKITSAISLNDCYQNKENTKCGQENNLIENGSFYWFATSNTKTTLFAWDATKHFITEMNFTDANGVRPILKLNSSIKTIGGTGTYQDPYILSPNE